MTGDSKPSAEDMGAAIAALSQHGDPLRPYQVEAVAKAIAERVNREVERRREAWQPIGSAPHDTVVLLFCPATAHFTSRIEIGMASWGWKNDVASNMSWHGYATHWRPLPDPPPNT